MDLENERIRIISDKLALIYASLPEEDTFFLSNECDWVWGSGARDMSDRVHVKYLLDVYQSRNLGISLSLKEWLDLNELYNKNNK